MISNFKAPCLEFGLSHSMCVFNPVYICCYESIQEIYTSAVQSIGRPLLNDCVKTHEGDAKTERGLKPKRLRMSKAKN